MARAGRRAGGSRSSAPTGSSWLPFATGLSIGAFVAFLVYLYGRAPAPAPAAPAAVPPVATGGATTSPPAGTGESETRVDKPQFDFYTILPETEVNVPAWQSEAEGADAAAATPAEDPLLPVESGGYVLQVGSFQRFQDADRAKAELALQGVVADIQKVVINGGETWYRVRVGPIGDKAALERTRSKLTAAGRTFLVLKIKPGAGD